MLRFLFIGFCSHRRAARRANVPSCVCFAVLVSTKRFVGPISTICLKNAITLTPVSPPLPRVQRTIESSKNTVRRGVFVGQAVRYTINSVPKLGTQLMRSDKNTVRAEVFIGQGHHFLIFTGRSQDVAVQMKGPVGIDQPLIAGTPACLQPPVCTVPNPQCTTSATTWNVWNPTPLYRWQDHLNPGLPLPMARSPFPTRVC